MKLKPINKRIIVEPQARQTISKGGIIIPDTANQKAPTQGMVMGMADSCDSDVKKNVKIGDIVLFSKFAGTEIIIPRKTVEEKDILYLMIPDTDILAVFVKEQEDHGKR